MSGISVAELYARLAPDTERGERPFSRDVVTASEQILRARDDAARATALNAWFLREQPCVFGKLAAGRDLISYCFLPEETLAKSDSEIGDAIQRARAAWKDQAVHGRKSAFVILAYSDRLLAARPDETLRDLATRLCSLYLRREVLSDRVYNDALDLWDLEFRRKRSWAVGVNVFSSAGDRRWWHDHRIPGGLAFSMNSVGHLVASEVRREAVKQAALEIEGRSKQVKKISEAEAHLAELQQTSVTSLGHALKFAMHTIGRASSGDRWECATSLLRADPDTSIEIEEVLSEKALDGMDINTYSGWYHTDISVPREYFDTAWERPHGMVPWALDFSYLHKRRSATYRRIAEGVERREKTSIRKRD